jgi:hypothetical protein
MKLIPTIFLAMMLTVGAAYAGSGWESDYDMRWNITVIDGCSGTTKTYYNCYITNLGQTHISFIADQGKGGITNGRVRTINTLVGCISVIRGEAD